MRLITLIAVFVASISTATAACSSCLVSSVVGTGASFATNRHMNMNLRHHHHGHAKSAFVYLAVTRLSTHFGTTIQQSIQRTLRADADADADAKEKVDDETIERDANSASSKEESKPVSAGMVGAIGIYKNFISPLLPPACRFLPTCSAYGVQAIEEFGANKGCVLTAWRLLRCSPFGGRGYDPPKWPPVSYTYGSY